MLSPDSVDMLRLNFVNIISTIVANIWKHFCKES